VNQSSPISLLNVGGIVVNSAVSRLISVGCRMPRYSRSQRKVVRKSVEF